MKKRYMIGLLAGLLTLNSGCNDWLDVNPRTEMKEKDIYQDEKGFKNVMNGIYIQLASKGLYGMYTSYYFPDLLAGYWYKTNNSTENYIMSYAYTNKNVESVIKTIWSKYFTAIAHINDLVENLDGTKVNFTYGNKELLYGEAYGLRAFLHFDVLRLYGPSPAVGKEHKAIPYMEEFTNIASRRLTVNQVLEKVAADLNKARELMREVDSYGPNYADLEETYAQDKRLKNRRFHLNYYAATALLARVQLYAGNTTEALAAAREIIGTAETLPVAPFELVTEVTSADRLFQNELLFGLEMKQMKVVISDYFGEAASKANLNNNTHMLAFSVSAQNNLCAPQNPADDDYRLKIWFKETSSNVANMSNKFEGVEMMPLIRISELYYIAAECLGGKEGLAYLNKIRAYRGLKALTDDSTLQNEIYKEYCKEFLNEGQMFYYYKRKYLSQLGVFKSKAIDPEAVYMLPLPVDEQDYGNKN